jgi:amino acid adenylation domain-containing protein
MASENTHSTDTDNYLMGKNLTLAINQTDVTYPKEKTLNQFLSETAKKFPQKIAVSTLNDQITYYDLEFKTNQFAQVLQKLNIKTGDKIGLAIDRSIEMVLTLIGIMKCGAAYLPFDPLYPTERIEYMLEDAKAQYLITSHNYKNKFKNAVKIILIEDILSALSDFDGTEFHHEFNSEDLLYILHTSGSTGKPKGVQITHYNVVNLLLSVQEKFGIKPDDKMLAITTISFDIAEVEIFLPLITGAEVMIADKNAVRDAEQLLYLLETQAITFMQATPSGWQMLLDAGWVKKFHIKILCGGEPMSKNLATKLLERCDDLWNVYGPTETTIYSTVHQVKGSDEVISIGKPLNNTQIYFLDEHLNAVEEGSIGEIYIAGDGVSKGYINNDDLTAQRYLINPFSKDKNAKIYRTGDLGKLLPNGLIQCLGRIDHQVKIRGYRIELEEIEQHLLAQPGINKAIVTAEELQPENQQLVAYIIPENYNPEYNYNNEIRAWRKELAHTLPSFMVPSLFHTLEKYPLTPNGKVDRKALSGYLKTFTSTARIYLDARTNEEKIIKNIWTKALKIDNISITDNFFELGGHSLLAVQIMQKTEAETGVKLPLASLFEHNTIEKIASLISNQKQEIKWNSLVKIKPAGNKTPLYMIHGTGLNVLLFRSIAKYVDEQQPVYGLQAQGLNGKKLTFTTIEEIADLYVNEVLEDNPDGPYAFIGYSLGGIIALEMAKQLKAKAKIVTMLGVVDTYIQNESYHKPLIENIKDKIFRQPKKLAFFRKQFLSNPLNTIGYQLILIKKLAFKLFGKTPLKEETLDESINKVYINAYMKYKLTAYDDVIHLFKVKKRVYYVDDPEYLGWKPYAPKGLVIKEIPGDHATFALPPNDKKSAEIFQKALDESNHIKL